MNGFLSLIRNLNTQAYITIGIEVLCDIVGQLQDFKDKRGEYAEEKLAERSKALSGKKNTYETVIKKNIYWNHVWKENSKAKKYLNKNKQWIFHQVIQTDGVGVSILYNKIIPKNDIKENTKNARSNLYVDDPSMIKKYGKISDDNIVGIDPNKNDLLYFYKDGYDQNSQYINKTFRYSKCQRNIETKNDR